MEPVCVKEGSLDPSALLVIVKQEEGEEGKEHEERFSVPQPSSLLVTEEEKDSEAGGLSAPLVADVSRPKDEPDTLEEEDKGTKAKRKKRVCVEKDWLSAATEGTPSGDPLWSCTFCQRCFSSAWELTGHCCTAVVDKDRGDPAKLEFRCPVCGDRFLRPTAFIMHKRSHVGQSRYACGVCGRTLGTFRKLWSHRRSHTRHRCLKCSQSFCSYEALRRHRCSQHGKEADAEEGKGREEGEGGGAAPAAHADGSLAQTPRSPQCSRCFMTFRDAETAERHQRFKHPAEYEQQLRGRTVFACCVCDHTFPSSRLLSAHQRTHSRWSLSLCGAGSSLQEEAEAEGGMERRMESDVDQRKMYKSKTDHAGSSSLRCLRCHIIFTDPRTRDRHMIAKHPASPPLMPPSPVGAGYLSPRPPGGQHRPYCCPSCGERFIQERSLAKHCADTHAHCDIRNAEAKKESELRSKEIR